MLARVNRLLLLAALLASGCAEVPTPAAQAAPSPPAVVAATPSATKSAEAAPIVFLADDLPGAMARARAEGKVVFVDAWAPWCHSCLSMQAYVLNDPSLRPLASRVIFAAVDTDKPASAAFLEHHAVKAWPTFFVLDPASDRVLGYWSGSGSVSEMRGLIEESLALLADSAPKDEASRALAEARAAHAAGELDRAIRAYEKAVTTSAGTWPRRSTAILGWIQALHGAKAWAPCARAGTAHLDGVVGAAMPADAASYVLDCTDHLTDGPDRRAARAAAFARLRAITSHPPEGSTVDDRADALGTLAEGLEASRDAAGAKAAHEQRLALLEAAARAAKTPEEAHTFDYLRAGTYVALGRPDEAVRMLEQRERELPTAYEPPARLANVLLKTGKLPEAEAAVERAIARAYGPRKLRYLKLRAEIQKARGETASELATLRDEVNGYLALPPGQASPEALADARGRLAAAEARAPR
jgi:tetratricopeptide (TPR) repeat protein